MQYSIRPDRVGMDPTRQDAELQVSRRDVATIVSEAGFPPQAASSHGWTQLRIFPLLGPADEFVTLSPG